ncbi:hypothetical protein DSO57_1015816 [Entomophthora muscae]|uniref:Uncharacterized protein n=1 Tax=Entomophthora muscae TaxID=34485 RepID=A0ACC2SU39_9FUNG|nr:hypothetical protein DSO57_1015816 [Entomophthora muscae]
MIHEEEARMIAEKVLDAFVGFQTRYNVLGVEISHLKNVTSTQLIPDFDPVHPMITSQEQEWHSTSLITGFI